jgi:hypothetical protein
MTISDALRQQVIEDANYRCAYCKAPSLITGAPLIMEHTLPRSLGGTDDRENLVAACYRCNEFKGAKIAALDPETNFAAVQSSEASLGRPSGLGEWWDSRSRNYADWAGNGGCTAAE